MNISAVMSYTIITTPGFIIGSRPRGEAGKLLSIFTRDLGLVLASAQGIRLEKSKLRYAARDYSFGEYSFVKGKEFWRLTDARDFVNTSTVEVFDSESLRLKERATSVDFDRVPTAPSVALTKEEA